MKRTLKRKCKETIIIDTQVWQGIAKEVNGSYDEQNVTIETAEGTAYQTQDMDEAYAQICRLNDAIASLQIEAKSKTMSILMTLTNAHTKHAVTAEFRAECAGMFDATQARYFFWDTRTNMRGSGLNSYVYLWVIQGLNITLLLYLLKDYLFYLPRGIPVLFAAAYFLTGILTNLFQGEKKIVFQTDEAKIKEYEKALKRKRLINLISSIAAGIFLIVIAAWIRH